MTMTAFDELLGDLAYRHRWTDETLTPAIRARILKAAAGRNRAEIARLAAELAVRSEAGVLQPLDLAQALGDLDPAPDPGPPQPSPHGAPTHPLDCLCGGAGVIRHEGALQLTDESGAPISAKRADLVVPCPGNRGRRMTAAQWASYQEANRLPGLDHRTIDPTAARLAAVEQARAALAAAGDKPNKENKP